MNRDYQLLKGLENTEGYKALQQLWIHQVSKIEEARDRSASRAADGTWRYFAGQEKGFKLAMTALVRALVDMERTDENVREENPIEKMLDELKARGETK